MPVPTTQSPADQPAGAGSRFQRLRVMRTPMLEPKLKSSGMSKEPKENRSGATLRLDLSESSRFLGGWTERSMNDDEMTALISRMLTFLESEWQLSRTVPPVR